MGAITPSKRDQPIFYVYEFWRPDTNQCFWVGKGHGDRAFRSPSRNFHFDNVIKKLCRNGMQHEVRIVRQHLTEAEALAYEIELIASRRASGASITNVTDGGEGVCGLRHSEATREKIKAKRAVQPRRPCSEETKRKLSEAHKGRRKGIPNPDHSARLKGRKLSDEHKAAISASNIGRIVAPETRKKIGAAHRGRVHSEETRRKFSQSHMGKRQSPELVEKRIAPLRGRKRSPEVIAAISGENNWRRRRKLAQS